MTRAEMRLGLTLKGLRTMKKSITIKYGREGSCRVLRGFHVNKVRDIVNRSWSILVLEPAGKQHGRK